MARTKQESKKTGKVPKRLGKTAESKTYPDGYKPRRARPGMAALRDIKRQQKSTLWALRKKPFRSLCREIAHEYKDVLRFQHKAFTVLQDATEAYIINLLKKSNHCAIHARRITLMDKDIRLAVAMSQSGDNFA